LQTAIVVGGENEVVHCDEYGRVKIRFPATRPADHQHAQGAGASDTDADSAWVRVATNWAGNGTSHCGTLALPRVGTEVLVAFLGGDPDKPIIICQLFNGRALPPPLSERANLPITRFLSGMRSQEIHGVRANQIRFDDTPREISAQLASDDGTSQLNLGWLTHPRSEHRRPRGEGAELRSDKAVAIRGGKGVLITANSSNQAEGKQLDRAELIGLADGLRDIADQLGKLAETHAKDPQMDRNWHNWLTSSGIWTTERMSPRREAAVRAAHQLSQSAVRLGLSWQVQKILCSARKKTPTSSRPRIPNSAPEEKPQCAQRRG
jgi:type VI secretion system secreted protein VgrG